MHNLYKHVHNFITNTQTHNPNTNTNEKKYAKTTAQAFLTYNVHEENAQIIFKRPN